jgi:hypothetical protein
MGSDNLNDQGVQFDESLLVAGMTKANMLDLADLSLGSNTDDMKERPLTEIAFMVERAARVRQEVGILVGVSRNLERRALSNSHWPIWAARELTQADSYSLPRRTGSGG